MQIEHVARVGLTARRTVQEQRKRAVSDRMFGQVIVYNQDIPAPIHEVFSHRTARIRGQILQRRRFGCRCRHNDRAAQRAVRR